MIRVQKSSRWNAKSFPHVIVTARMIAEDAPRSGSHLGQELSPQNSRT